VAASLAAVVVVASRPKAEAALGAVEFITGPREVNTLRLDDGTVVRLAPGSRLEFENHSPRVRQVRFEGVAYFAVARDPARPFVIRTRGGDAVVLGTRFELRTRDDETRVVVVEGRVALEAEGARREVASSQMGHVRARQPPTVVDVESVHDFLGWVDGLLVFQSTPLSQVTRELAKHYGVQIEIRDAELARREVTAWLDEQSFDAALTAICGAVGAACRIDTDRAVMSLPRRAARLTDSSPRGTRK
jgi:transmembrane sensor